MSDALHLVPVAATRWTTRATGDVRVAGVVTSLKDGYDSAVVLLDEKRHLLGLCHVSGSRSAKEMPWNQFDKYAKDCFFATVHEDVVVSLSHRNQQADYGCAMLDLSGAASGKKAKLTISSSCDAVLKKICPQVDSLCVRGSNLASTVKGPVLALLVSDTSGQTFLVAALLAADVWEAVPIDSAFSTLPLVVVMHDATVLLARGDVVSTPSGSAEPHSSVEAALGDIAVVRGEPRLSMTRRSADIGGEADTPPRCLHFRIVTFLPGSGSLHVLHLQSGAFRPQAGSMCASTSSHPILTDAAASHDRLLLAAVVPQVNHSFLVQLVLDPWAARLQGSRPVASAATIAELTSPLCIAMLRHGPAVVSLVLSQDCGIYAAFELGEGVAVSVGTAGLVADQPRNKLQFEPPEIYKKPSKKKAVRQLSFVTMHRVGDNMVLCADGTYGTLLKLQNVANIPRPQLSCGLANIRNAIAAPRLTTHQLDDAIAACCAIMAATPPHEASPCYVVLRHLMPTLVRCHDPAARVAAVQAIARRLMAWCSRSSTGLDLDWSITAEMDAALCRSVAKSGLFGDVFFATIAAQQITRLPPYDRLVVAEEAVRALSTEARRAAVIRKPLPDWHRDVLDVLASGTPGEAIIEEWCRANVSTRQLSSGAWVVEVREEFEPLLHVVGLALLAQCLDMQLHVHVDGNSLLCRTRPLPSLPRVVIVPRAIISKAAFDVTLVLACDAVSTGQNVRVDVALFAALLGRRSHAAVTILQLFAVDIERICIKTAARERAGMHQCCTTSLMDDADVLSFLLDDGPSNDEGVRIVTVVAHFLRDDVFGVDEQLLQALRGRLPAELLQLAVACVIHQHTDHLVGAQNNFAAAVMKSFLPRYACKATVVAEYSERLKQCAERLDRSFAVADEVVNTQALRHGLVAPPSGAMTVASGTLHHDLRLLALVKHQLQLLRAVEMFRAQTSAYDRSKLDSGTASVLSLPHVAGCLTSLRMYGALCGTSLPTEGLQQACLDAVDAALPICSSFAQLTPFLREVLRLCQAERSSTIAIKRKFCALDDTLTALGEAPIQLGDELSRALVQATSLCKYHDARLEHYLGSAGAPLLSEHNLESRAFLINSAWAKNCWPAECETIELEAIAKSAGAVDVFAAPRVDVGVDLGRALFSAICHLVPPIRLHTMAPPVSPPSPPVIDQSSIAKPTSGPAPAPQQNILVEVKQNQPNNISTVPPAPAPAPAAAPPLPPPVPNVPMALDPAAVKLSSTSLPTVSSPTATNGSPPNMAPSPVTPPAAVSAPIGTLPSAAPAATPVTGPVAVIVPLSDHFSPATVAWWEQPAAPIDDFASRQRAMLSTAGVGGSTRALDNDTATSYSTTTTVTSCRRARKGKGGEGRRSRSSSDEESKDNHRRHRHHHRCARHAVPSAPTAKDATESRPTLLTTPALALSPPRAPVLWQQQHSANAPPQALLAPQLLSAPTSAIGQASRGHSVKLFNAFDVNLDPASSPRPLAPPQAQVALLAPVPLISAGPQLQAPLPPSSGFFLRPPPLAKRSTSSSSSSTSSSSSSDKKKKKKRSKKSSAKKASRNDKEVKRIDDVKSKKKLAVDVMMTEDLNRHYKKLADESPLPPGIVAYKDETTGAMKISSALPSSGNLSPLEDAQFRRYVDELLSRNTATAPATAASGMSQQPSSPTGKLTTDMAHADFLRNLTMQQQAMFQLHQEALVNAQRDNALLLRRAVEDLRGPPMPLGASVGALNASVSLMGSPGSGYYGPQMQQQVTPPQPSGLNAVQQSQLLQQTMEQREKLMRMNDQLLQMQQASARNEVASTRVSGVFPPPANSLQPLQASALYPVSGSSQPIPSSLSPTIRTDGSMTAQQVHQSQQQLLPRPVSSKGIQSSLPPTPTISPPHFTQSNFPSQQQQQQQQAPLSLQASMRELNDMNMKLSQVNASADDIERALAQSRELLRRHSSQHAASSLQVEQQSAIDALKIKAASLEAQLLAGQARGSGPKREFLFERTDGTGTHHDNFSGAETAGFGQNTTFVFDEQNEQAIQDGPSAGEAYGGHGSQYAWGSQTQTAVTGDNAGLSSAHNFLSQGIASTSRAFWRGVNPPQSPPRSAHGTENHPKTPQRLHSSPMRPASGGTKRVGSAPRHDGEANHHGWEVVDEGIRRNTNFRAASPKPLSLADVFASAGPNAAKQISRSGSARAVARSTSPPPAVVDKRLAMYAEQPHKAKKSKSSKTAEAKSASSVTGAGVSSSATAGGAATSHPAWELRDRRLFDVKDKFADKQKHLLEVHTVKRVNDLRNALM